MTEDYFSAACCQANDVWMQLLGHLCSHCKQMGAENGVSAGSLAMDPWVKAPNSPHTRAKDWPVNSETQIFSIEKGMSQRVSKCLWLFFTPYRLLSGCFTYHENPAEQSGHEFAQQSGTQAGDVHKRPLREAGRWEEGAEFVFDSLRDVTTNHVLLPDWNSIAQKKPPANTSCSDSN